MPDHVHVLVEGESQTADLKKLVAVFKQKSGFWFRQMRRKEATTEENESNNVEQGFSLARLRGDELWQINYYEHVLRSDEATEKVARYILENPVRKGLAADFRNYPFSWCGIFDIVGQGFSLADLNVQQDSKQESATRIFTHL